MTKIYRIGIIGIGAIARLHALAIRDIENAQLVGGCCRSPEKGKKFAAEFGCGWYGSTESMLANETLDLVTICTPSGAHLEPALQAFQHGVHVLCEKPLEIALSRAEQMIAAADTAGVYLGGIFPQRFNPVVQAAHAAAANGRFGKLAVASAMVPWWRDDAYYSADRWQGTMALDGGGALINQSIHAIDALQWLAAAAGCGPVAEIVGFAGRLGHPAQLIEVEDTAAASLRFESGTLGQIVAATSVWPGSSQRLLLAGRDGTVEIHENRLIQWHFRGQLPEDDDIRSRFCTELQQGGASDPMAIDYTNHTRNISDFLTAIERQRRPAISGKEACKSLAIIHGIYESAQSGQIVHLPTERA